MRPHTHGILHGACFRCLHDSDTWLWPWLWRRHGVDRLPGGRVRRTEHATLRAVGASSRRSRPPCQKCSCIMKMSPLCRKQNTSTPAPVRSRPLPSAPVRPRPLPSAPSAPVRPCPLPSAPVRPPPIHVTPCGFWTSLCAHPSCRCILSRR
jgi:hypothetical protein